MENRIINKYGALVHSNISEAFTRAETDYNNAVHEIVEKHQLTPAEIRCVAAIFGYQTVFCEMTLRSATNLKQAERSATE